MAWTQAAAVCREAIGPQADRHFRASLFLRFARDARGAIPLLSFFHYLMRRNALLQTVRAHAALQIAQAHSCQPFCCDCNACSGISLSMHRCQGQGRGAVAYPLHKADPLLW